MNAHTKLTMHLSRWMYKRGRNKGDAPADQTKRAKSHFRVIKGNGGQMIVRFYNADILTAYEDGRIRLDTEGWDSHPTTRVAMNAALCFFGMGAMFSVRNGGHSQTGIRMNGKTYRYYDGMEFNAEGAPLTALLSFSAKRADRERTAEFRKDIKDSGFVGMFPVLYEAATPEDSAQWVRSIKDAMCSEYLADQWPRIVASAKYTSYWARNSGKPSHEDHKAALKALIASQTRTMTKIVKLDETVL